MLLIHPHFKPCSCAAPATCCRRAHSNWRYSDPLWATGVELVAYRCTVQLGHFMAVATAVATLSSGLSVACAQDATTAAAMPHAPPLRLHTANQHAPAGRTMAMEPRSAVSCSCLRHKCPVTQSGCQALEDASTDLPARCRCVRYASLQHASATPECGRHSISAVPSLPSSRGATLAQPAPAGVRASSVWPPGGLGVG